VTGRTRYNGRTVAFQDDAFRLDKTIFARTAVRQCDIVTKWR
jgi:hypothetical protein